MLVRKRDWVADISGLVMVSAGWATWTFLLFQPTSLTNKGILWVLVALSVPLYAGYCLRHENDLTVLQTGLAAAENREIAESVMQKLGWEIFSHSPYTIVAGASNNPWWGAGQTATVLVADDRMYANVVHGATIKGRLPFYFGSNQRKLKRLVASMQALSY
ncbi:hypothetical protein [Hymenobacter coalescens]